MESENKGIIELINKENYPKEIVGSHSGLTFGETREESMNKIIRTNINKTLFAIHSELKIAEPCIKTHFRIFYTTDDFDCTCAHHKEKRKAVMVFGTASCDGHAFAICSDCLFRLSLILLKNYMYGELYNYSDDNNYISLTKADNDKKCYLCKNEHKDSLKLNLNNHYLILCPKCLDQLTKNILSSPFVRLLYYEIFKTFNETILEKKQLNDLYIDGYLNCLLQKNDVTYINHSRQEALAFPLRNFIVSEKTNEIKCMTLKHNTPVNADFKLLARRPNDKMAFAICNDCLKVIYDALSSVNSKNPKYKNKEKALNVHYSTPKPNHACYCCGNIDINFYAITLGRIHFRVCEKCMINFLPKIEKLILRKEGKQQKNNAELNETKKEAVSTDENQ